MENGFVDIHTHQTSCQALSPTASGVHPWALVGLSDAGLARELAALDDVPAQVIGEIGLDYARSKGSGAGSEGRRTGSGEGSGVREGAVADDRARQLAAFRAQLAVAERRGLPVVLHVVRAMEDAMAVLAEFSLPAVVFHGFIGSAEQARRAVERGYFLSFGVRSFASPRTVEAMRSVPLDHIFLETDDDPTPIGEVYARAAEILKIPVNQLSEQIATNYKFLIRN